MPLRREVRTLQLRQQRYFEDRLWPTFAALVLLAGALATMAVHLNRLDDPRPWQNSWVQLMAIAATLGGSLWLVSKSGSPRTRRYQFSVVLSFAAHVLLAIFLGYQQLMLERERIQQAEVDQVDQPIEEEVLPKIVVSVPTAANERQEIEKPLASASPLLQTDEFTHERSTPKRSEAPQLSEVLPDAEPQLLPHTERLRRPQESVAHRASTPGRRSRREIHQPAPPSMSAVEFAQTAPAEPSRPEPRPRSAASTNSLVRADASPQQVAELLPRSEAPSSEQAVVASAEPRREQQEEPSASSRSATQRERSFRAFDTMAASAVVTDTTVTSSQPQASSPQPTPPQAEPLQRSQAAAPLLARDVPQALPDTVAPGDHHPQPRQRLSEELPTIAKDTDSSPQRRRVEVATNTSAVAATDQLAEVTAARSRQILDAQPTALSLARTAPREQPASSKELVDMVEMYSPTPPVSTMPTRVTSDSQPSINPDGTRRESSQRAIAAAQLAAGGSMQTIEVPTAPTNVGGSGSGAPSAIAPAAKVARVAQTPIDANFVAPTRSLAGSTESTIAGQLSLAPVPRRLSADTISGLQSGGGNRQPRRRRVPIPAAPAKAEVATLDAASPTSIASSAGPLPSSTEIESPARQSTNGSSTLQSAEPLALPNDPFTGERTSAGDQRTARRDDTIPDGRRSERLAMAPRRRDSPVASLPTTATAIAEPASSAASPIAANRYQETKDISVLSSGMALGRSTGQLPVLVGSETGTGGLNTVPAPAVGLPDRRAQREAALVHVTPARVLRKQVGGSPSISGAARVPAAAFTQRGRRQEELLSGGDGKPSAKTEAAIELGLEFLSRLQLPNGRWEFDQLNDDEQFTAGTPASLRADAAATGLALLAYLGAGYDHFDDKYQDVVRNGLEYLLGIQKPSGELFPEDGQSQSAVARFYSHGIAALSLSEAFGMTGDPQLRQPAQRALNYIVQSQHPDYGGWRYVPGINTDLSVTGWQLMALRSGELADLDVPPATYDRIRGLLNACREQSPEGVRYRYNPWASAINPRTRHGRNPSTVMTAVGLLAELYLGSNRDDQLMQSGAKHLALHLPESGPEASPAPTGTLGNPMRDTYYWYYATQVMFHMGGEHWREWNDRLHPVLIDTQTAAGAMAGSWNPQQPIPDKWASYGGRLYVTAMNLLSLEVYYRHLPLYEMTAQ